MSLRSTFFLCTNQWSILCRTSSSGVDLIDLFLLMQRKRPASRVGVKLGIFMLVSQSEAQGGND